MQWILIDIIKLGKSKSSINFKLYRATPQTTIMSKIFHLSIIIATLFIIPTISLAFAAETAGEYIDRKAEIWNLFFRMMTVAFVVGGVIAGTMVWQVWRFRESNPNSKPTEYEEKGEF